LYFTHVIIKTMNFTNYLDNRSFMPAIATSPNLSHYPRLRIASYREQLRQTDDNSLQLSYRYRNKPYNYCVQLTKTRCNYGGSRYWLICLSCSKKTSVLYCAGLYVCRHCIGANYGSQLQQPVDRIYSRLNAIRERLSWQVGIIHGISERPKGMHAKTYNRLLKEYEQLEQKIIGTHYATT